VKLVKVSVSTLLLVIVLIIIILVKISLVLNVITTVEIVLTTVQPVLHVQKNQTENLSKDSVLALTVSMIKVKEIVTLVEINA
jgi:hypothetical protein